MSTGAPEFTVRRPVYHQEELHRLCEYAEPRKIPIRQEISQRWKRISPLNVLRKTIPLFEWLPNYDWKRNFLGDIMAGITVAVMHIPQGMAYAILGNVPSIIGIYMAIFPVLVYIFLGTSRHNSMGTFAVICMMTGNVITSYSDNVELSRNGTSFDGENVSSVRYSPVEIGTVVTFTVALLQIGMYTLRLGVISSLLDDSLISGFTSSAGIHVFTSQLKDLLGLTNLPRRKGMFKLILTFVDIFKNIDSINIAALTLSSITIVALVFNNEILKKKIEKICQFPLPIELLIIVTGTLVSMKMNLTDVYNIVPVGDIPLGLPAPSIPPLSLVPSVLLDSAVITIVSYTISISMALLFAKKVGYEIDSNQELIAQGLGNLTGSFFSCMPFAASLSRSLIQQAVGGNTQLASLISCGILFTVLLWIGPFFESLPRCILASIIVVALKGILTKISEFRKFWKLDKWNAGIWAATFFMVIILDVSYGLFIGLLVCLMKIIVVSIRPYSCKLSLAPGTEIYLDTKRYKGTIEIPGVTIFHYAGCLNFASQQYFCEQMYKVTELSPRTELCRRNKTSDKEVVIQNDIKIHTIIVDFTALSHIDLSGVNTIQNLIEEYHTIGVSIYIVGCSGPVYEMLKKCNLINYKENSFFSIYPTISDAVYFAQCRNTITPIQTMYGGINCGLHQRINEVTFQ